MDEKKIIFLQGRKVILRPLRESTDVENCLRWINNPEVSRYLVRFLPITEHNERKFFTQSDERFPTNIVLAIETIDGIHIGTMGLHNISWKDRTATTGAVIGEKEYWNKGYGTDAKMILLDYALQHPESAQNNFGSHRF